MKRIAILIVVLFWATASHAFETDGASHCRADRYADHRAEHRGPPPEAFKACEGKNAGDQAQFVSPNGHTITGTCEKYDDRMFLRPDNPPPEMRDGGEQPPRGNSQPG